MIDQVPPAIQSLTPLLYKALLGVAVGGLGALFMFPIKKAMSEWKSLKENTASILQELTHQRQNCLSTLQSQGDRQIELLEKAVDSLSGIHTAQAEMSGFMKASAVFKTSRSRAKK